MYYDDRECQYCGYYYPDCECDFDVSDVTYCRPSQIQFQDPGGDSALRAATKTNPRNKPCPTCKGKDLLTPQDVAAGYQCDSCANKAEGGGY